MGYFEDQQKRRAEEYNQLPLDIKNRLEKELPRREKRQIEDISYISIFTEITKEADKFAKKWNKSIKDVSIEHTFYEEYNDIRSEVHLEIDGLETDEQYHARLAEYYESIRRQEERDRQEFERLSAKFAK